MISSHRSDRYILIGQRRFEGRRQAGDEPPEPIPARPPRPLAGIRVLTPQHFNQGEHRLFEASPVPPPFRDRKPRDFGKMLTGEREGYGWQKALLATD